MMESWACVFAESLLEELLVEAYAGEGQLLSWSSSAGPVVKWNWCGAMTVRLAREAADLHKHTHTHTNIVMHKRDKILRDGILSSILKPTESDMFFLLIIPIHSISIETVLE